MFGVAERIPAVNELTEEMTKGRCLSSSIGSSVSFQVGGEGTDSTQEK